MYACSICGKYSSDKIRIPQTKERRREFAERCGLNAERLSDFLNLPVERYICSDHFDKNDCLIDDNGRITKIKRTALPKENFQHLPIKATTTTTTTTTKTTTTTTPTTAVTGNDLPFNGFGSSYNANLFGNGRGGYDSLFGNSRLGLNNSRGGYGNQLGNIHGSSENILKFESSPTKNFIPTTTPEQIIPPSTEFKITQYDNNYEEHDFDTFEPYDGSQHDPTAEIGMKRKHEIRDETADKEKLSSPPKKKFYNMDEDCEEECDERVQYVVISIERLLEIFNTCTAGSIKYYCSGCNKKLVFATQETIPDTKIYKGNALLSSAAQITPISYPVILSNFFADIQFSFRH
uniref:THAP-type domain-containing protein n=1 Tax=Panagrolaimus davidi TaxID=227884 RepID=A0A914PH09_9BILA